MPGKPRQPRKPAATSVQSSGRKSEEKGGTHSVSTTKRATVDGRPACYLVDECGLPEFMDNVGLCGRHWALRPDVRKVARRG